MNNNKAKKWVFTLNNYESKDIEFFKNLSYNYIKFGEEIGESGTPHLQGFVIFKNQTRLSALKKLHSKVHWEIQVGPDEACSNYCSKGSNIFEQDNRSQGKRNDILSAANLVKEKGIMGVVNEMPEMYVKYHSGLEKLFHRISTDRTIKPIVTWIYGKTGTGKTRHVFDKHQDIWISNKNLQWWDGYENQEVVLIDDFRRDFCTFHELLRILDRYPYNVAVKGGFRKLNSKYIYITSPFHPKETYETREDIQQLLRRIDEIIEKDSLSSFV